MWDERVAAAQAVPGERRAVGAHRQPEGEVHALPAGVPRPEHRRRPGDDGAHRHERGPRGDGRGLRVARRASCSTRPRTGCTRSRRCSSRRSEADGPTVRVLVALGGNALLKRGEPMTADVQRDNVRTAATALAPVAGQHQLVLSHGNGPQVGLLALQAAAYTDVEAYPLDLLGAQTEGMIGYLIEQELGNLLPAEVPFATILTMVEVDRRRPRLRRPDQVRRTDLRRCRGRGAGRGEGLGVQARRRSSPPGRPVAGAEADLRDPADPVAAGARRGGDLRRRRRDPHDVGGRARNARSAASRRSSTRTSPASCSPARSTPTCS